ncbi:MAG: tRNA lysidine(34) synthetase TilS, partial [Clostridia bacterium]|nr:tRNA lysidine(34) synthetase TilS [Clostridia bacterium]
VSGGRDSMALLYHIIYNARAYNIYIYAVNCDHSIRGEESVRDSEFVAAVCKANGIPLYFFKAEEKLSSEEAARRWRYSCFEKLISENKCDFVATAHHLGDTAETVLFNLARGSSLAGLTGIGDDFARGIVRPMKDTSPEEIEKFVKEHHIDFVTDSTNCEDDYTRNKIRHSVLPALAAAVDGAVGNVCRFASLAREDEEFLSRLAETYIQPIEAADGKEGGSGWLILPCEERVIFKRAARKVVKAMGKRDYTAVQLETLFKLQGLATGKKFEFLGLVATKRKNGVFVQFDESFGDPSSKQAKK